MAEVYEASEETKQIIRDWADSPFKAGEMPDEWFDFQPIAYTLSFGVKDRIRNTKAINARKLAAKDKKKLTATKLVSSSYGDSEYIYVVKIEGNTNVAGYGYTSRLPQRMREHFTNTAKDGSLITQWNTFEFPSGEAKTVERLVMKRFPLIECTISGFIRESTNIDLHEEVVHFVTEHNLQALGRISMTIPKYAIATY